MFMKNLDFADEKTKKMYRSITAVHKAVDSVVSQLITLNGKMHMLNIYNGVYSIDIAMQDANNAVYNVNVNFVDRKIRVSSPYLPYKEVYDNYEQKNCYAIGYEYQNSQRIIFRRNSIFQNAIFKNEYDITLKENLNDFNIVLQGGGNTFDINIFINSLLSADIKIDNIRELLLLIANLIDICYFDIKLSDELGSIIKIKYGSLDKYVECRQQDNEIQKIFLKNGEFLLERVVRENCDEVAPLMKKIGVYNGKEKRKN